MESRWMGGDIAIVAVVSYGKKKNGINARKNRINLY